MRLKMTAFSIDKFSTAKKDEGSMTVWTISQGLTEKEYGFLAQI